MKPIKSTTPKRKPVSKPKPHHSPPSAPPSPNTMPTPSLVRELTRLRFTRQEKDQQLSALRSSVVQQRNACSFRRHASRVDNDDDVFGGPAEATRAGSASRLALAATEDRYQAAALELAMVEMEVELVHWRDWLGDAAHEREDCEVCLKAVVAGEGDWGDGLSRKGKERCGGSGERSVGPLNWEKRSGASDERSGRVEGKNIAESVESQE